MRNWKNMDVFIHVLFLSAVFSSGVWSKKHSHEKKRSDGKIVGGYNTTIGAHPYQAYLLLQKGLSFYQCGGSIISPNYILTAAHCLSGVQRAYVRVGSTDSDTGGQQYQSSMLLIHPLYNPLTSNRDVGLIKLMQKMNLDGKTTSAVPLAAEGTTIPDGSNVTVTGWGTTTEGGETSNTLMAVNVPVISNERCRQMMGGITNQMFCAGLPEGGKDSCQGDSGGPAVNDSGVQEGIVSFGIGCAQPGNPGVYTRVSAVRAWIKFMSGV